MKKIILVLLFSCLGLNMGWAQSILSFKQEKDRVLFTTANGELQLYPLANNAIRVKFVKQQPTMPEWIYAETPTPAYKIKKEKGLVSVCLSNLKAQVDMQTGKITFLSPKGDVLLMEKERELSPSSVQNMKTFCAMQAFHSTKDEALFGLGQFQDGYLNVRGLSRHLTQVNTQISIPFIMSNKGYGILWNNYGLTDFNPADHKINLVHKGTSGDAVVVDVTSTEGRKKEVRSSSIFAASITVPAAGCYSIMLDVGQPMARKHHLRIGDKTVFDMSNVWLPPTTSAIIELEAGVHKIEAELEKDDQPTVYFKEVEDETVFRSPTADCIDYTFFAGNADDVIAAYRNTTGEVPMMPKWALGYIHCRERFNTQQEIIQTATRFRKDSLPMDLIVQDWQYWGKLGWNAMQFDEANYPDPKKLVDDLHAIDARLMLSVWSKIDPKSEVGQIMNAKGYYIPNTSWVDFFNPEAAACYWDNFSERLLKPYGIDAWWQDATEPENDDLVGKKIWNGTIPGELFRNTYPLLVNKVVYEGSRRDAPNKRVMILTRSAFPGMQRYGTVTWSGDVGHDWETLRRQIVGGLGMTVSGLPWWTYDAGGFFRPGDNQYIDPKYHECFLRWLQTSVFLPLMRVHGYMSNTEFWNYGARMADLARKSLNTRYSLFPYIYSEAANISFKGGTMMRPLVMDYASDTLAISQKYEYMFGSSLLVAPVVEENKKTWDVYLPENKGGWYDFWTGQFIAEKGWKQVPVTLEQIPVFVKAGTILPFADGKFQTTQAAAEADWIIKVFAGADGTYTVYEDDGTNYDYEKGLYSNIRFIWNDARNELTITRREGKFPGMNTTRNIRIIKISNALNGNTNKEKTIIYNGQKVSVKL